MPFESPKTFEVKGLTPHEKETLFQNVKKFSAEAIKPRDFVHAYGVPEIEKDEKFVRGKKEWTQGKENEVQKELVLYSQAFEMLLAEFGRFWLPGHIYKASEYDDLTNGADLLWEVADQSGVHRSSLDLTSNELAVNDKLQPVVKRLEEGLFPKVKYFKSRVDGSKGPLSMPNFVVGTDFKKVLELIRLYIKYKEAPNLEAERRFEKMIGGDPLGSQILLELVDEIDEYIKTLENLPEKTLDAETKVHELQTLKRILVEYQEKKEATVPMTPTTNPNTIQAAISESLREHARTRTPSSPGGSGGRL